MKPVAAEFADTPKIIRSVLALGEVQRMAESGVHKEHMSDIVNKMEEHACEVKPSPTPEHAGTQSEPELN